MRMINVLFYILLSLFCMRLEARMYFIHVPKTGGTSMRLLLEQQLSESEIYPHRNQKAARTPVLHALVSGHLPYWFCKKKDPEFERAFKVTILREPVSRYLSFLISKLKAEPSMQSLERVFAVRLTQSDKYDDGLIDNALCRYLADDPNLEGEDLLENAKKNLLSFDACLFQESYNEDVIALFKRFGIDLDERDVPKINVTGKVKTHVHEELLQQVKQLNELDSRLYSFAKNHYEKRTSQYQLRSSSFADLLQPAASIDYTFDLPLNGRGWTYRERVLCETAKYPFYRWVTDVPAEISFALEPGSDYALSFDAWPIHSDVIPYVKANGVPIALTKVNEKKFAQYDGVIPADILTGNALELTFYSDKAFYYWDVFPLRFNRNHPMLSFAVKRIQIVRKAA